MANQLSARILQELFHGPLSAQVLSARLGESQQTIGNALVFLLGTGKISQNEDMTFCRSDIRAAKVFEAPEQLEIVPERVIPVEVSLPEDKAAKGKVHDNSARVKYNANRATKQTVANARIVREAIRNFERPVTQSEIMKATGLPRPSIYTATNYLLQDGTIGVSGAGRGTKYLAKNRRPHKMSVFDREALYQIIRDNQPIMMADIHVKAKEFDPGVSKYVVSGTVSQLSRNDIIRPEPDGYVLTEYDEQNPPALKPSKPATKTKSENVTPKMRSVLVALRAGPVLYPTLMKQLGYDSSDGLRGLLSNMRGRGLLDRQESAKKGVSFYSLTAKGQAKADEIKVADPKAATEELFKIVENLNKPRKPQQTQLTVTGGGGGTQQTPVSDQIASGISTWVGTREREKMLDSIKEIARLFRVPFDETNLDSSLAALQVKLRGSVAELIKEDRAAVATREAKQRIVEFAKTYYNTTIGFSVQEPARVLIDNLFDLIRASHLSAAVELVSSPVITIPSFLTTAPEFEPVKRSWGRDPVEWVCQSCASFIRGEEHKARHVRFHTVWRDVAEGKTPSE